MNFKQLQIESITLLFHLSLSLPAEQPSSPNHSVIPRHLLQPLLSLCRYLGELCYNQVHRRLLLEMFGLRASVSRISDISLQLLQSVPLRGLRAQCISIKAGMEIPDNKRLEFALPYIHGIGRARARQIISELNMENKLAKDLTKRELFILGEQLNKYILGRELTTCVMRDIQRLASIQCYRGIRHTDGLPCRGQRTKTNARTIKAKGTPIGLRRK